MNLNLFDRIDWRGLFVFSVFLGLNVFPLASEAQEHSVRGIYYVTEIGGGGIDRVDADGSNRTSITSFVSQAVIGMAVDSPRDRFYWLYQHGGFWSADLAGHSRQLLVDRGSPLGKSLEVQGFALDPQSGALYYVVVERDRAVGRSATKVRLMRRDFESGLEVVLVEGLPLDPEWPDTMEFDEVDRYLYVQGWRFKVDDLVPGTPFASVTKEEADSRWVRGSDPISGWLYSVSGDLEGVRRLERRHRSSMAVETSPLVFSGTGIESVQPVKGTDTVYFLNLDFRLVVIPTLEIYRTNFLTGEHELIVPRVDTYFPLFALDLVESDSIDIEPPVVTVLTPESGDTNLGNQVLRGTVTDNHLVSRMSWSLNGVEQGELTWLPDGSFEVPSVQLQPGENRLRLVARDIQGNEGETVVTVNWVPDRRLYLEEPSPISEGDRLVLPIQFRSDGDVGGITFKVDYDPTVLGKPVFDAGPAMDGGGYVVDTATPGCVKVTLTHLAPAIPPGIQTLAWLSFRALSIPDETSIPLGVEIEDVSDPAGNALVIGNVSAGTAVTIRRRLHTGDINTNGELDVGDVHLMQRLLVGIDEKRAWDDALNDLNGSGLLDSGDVVSAMRTVVGLRPQPGISMEGALALPQEGPSAFLTVDNQYPRPGDVVTVRVRLEAVSFDFAGVAFSLEYPVEGLRLADAEAHWPGALIGGDASVLWNVAPSGADYAAQTGSIFLAASSSAPWPGSAGGGELAVFEFEVQADFDNEDVWSVSLNWVSLPSDGGYDVTEVAGDRLSLIGRPEDYLTWAALHFSPDQLSDDHVAGWGADPDLDLLTNGQEYLEGSPPLNGSAEALDEAVTVIRDGGLEVPAIRLRRSQRASEGSFRLEMSGDLHSWEVIDHAVWAREPASTPGFEYWHVGPRDPLQAWNEVFFRLVFTPPVGNAP